jgi:hypothetical protein
MTAALPGADKLKWSKDARQLAPTLASGKIYCYAEVPLQAFNNFRDADSASGRPACPQWHFWV